MISIQALTSKIIGRTENKWLDGYLIIILIISLTGFLSIKGLTNTCLFLLLAPSIFFIKRSFQYTIPLNKFNLLIPILITLALPTIAIFISQALLAHCFQYSFCSFLFTKK